MKTLFKEKRFIYFAGAYLICSIVVLSQPLFNYLGYEFSAVMGIISFVISSLYSYKIYSDIKTSKQKTYFAEIIFLSLRNNFLLLIIPFISATMCMIFVKNCSYFTGVLFYLLIPCITVVYSVSISLLFFTFFNRHKRFYLYIAFVVINLFSFAEIFFNPQLFFYNPFIGYFTGVLYDEELYISSGFFLYRLITIFQSIIFFALANVYYQVQTDMPFMKKLKKAKYVLNLPIIFLLVLICVFMFFRNDLRITREKEYIKSCLGNVYTTPHFYIYYSSENLKNEEIREIAYKHEFYFQKICKELNLNQEEKIESFIYPDADAKFNLIGAKYTLIAKPWLRQIHLNEQSIDAVLKHELVHVMAGDFGLPIVKVGRSAALVEGLAMAIEWQWGYRSLDTYSANIFKFLPNTDFKKIISTFGFLSSNQSVAYVLSGSFIKYLLDNYGAEKLKETYYSGDYEKSYGKNEDVLIKEWQKYLSSYCLEKEDSAVTVYTFKKPAIFQKVCARTIANLNEEAFRFMRNGNYAKSIELFSKSISLSNNNDAKTGMIISFLRSGDYNSVIGYTDNLLKDEKNKVFFLPMKLYRSDALWQKAYIENNEALYDSAFKECSEVFYSHLNDNYDFSARVRMNILSSKIYRVEMREYFISGKDDGLKVLILSEMINKNPTFQLGKLLLGKHLYNKNDYSKALYYLNKIDDSFLSNFFLSEKYKIAGLCCLKIGNYEYGIHNFKHSIDFQTNESIRNELLDYHEFAIFMKK